MTTQLNVAKVHHVEYQWCGWFAGDNGMENLQSVLNALDVSCYCEESDCLEIDRAELEDAVKTLKSIDRGECVNVDIDQLTECLDNASMTLNECIECFEWLLNNSDKEHEDTWIYVSFF